MNCMQYKIVLPSDYDMNIIRNRIVQNASKTDGFDGLFFKMYLLADKTNSAIQNEYAPLYIWNQSNGMNKFIFGGYYDNILASFGWQQINSYVPYQIEGDLFKAKYVFQVDTKLESGSKMSRPEYSLVVDGSVAKMLVYNPQQWLVSEYHFFEQKPVVSNEINIYEILHISKGEDAIYL